MAKSIIIIGGGLTGLAAGCYGQMNGYRTIIYEMHSIAGGVCTGWKRKGYTIDGAMNWLVGTNPKSSFYHFWEELGAAGAWKIHNHEYYAVSEDGAGHDFRLYCDADQFERYLLQMVPEDKEPIQEFTGAIRAYSLVDTSSDKPVELLTPAEQARLKETAAPASAMQKWSTMTGADFARRFKSPVMRGVFSAMGQFPLSMIIWVLSLQHSKSAGYVIGGALALVKPIEERYRKLGGEIRYKSRVVKILVENDRAVGVKLADGKEHRADWVIAAADGRSVIFDMLGGQYVDDKIKAMYERPNLFAPLVYVGLGVKRNFDDVPASVGGLRFPLKKPITIAGKEESSLNALIYKYDPTLSPAGKTVVIVYYNTDYDYWQKLRQDMPRYQAEKEHVARDVIAGLEQRFPGITAQVEMHDVATPLTWERYTGNWRGAYEGWMWGAHPYIPKTLPGLDNFYMAGQWVNAGGGMPTAVMSGSHTLQLVCAKDGRPFTASKP